MTQLPAEQDGLPPDTATILLVDDDIAILEGVADFLEFYGYRVLTASDGIEVLHAMRQHTPDLVISDIMMPEMDGHEFFQEVRNNDDWTAIPFIFLTARGQRIDIRRGQSLGADAYLTKPFDPEDLLIAVRARLKRVREIQSITKSEVDRMKNQLMTIFSHELRTPLTYIYGFVNLLQDDREELDAQYVDEMLTGVQRGASRLLRLVEDLMMMVRLDSGMVEMEITVRRRQVPVRSLVEQLELEYQPVAADNGVSILVDVQPDLEIVCSPVYIRDILARLLDNAIKFSRTGKRIWLSAYGEGDDVVFVVRDEGVGFSPEDRRRAFEPFEQINRQLMEQQGVGLGLPIVRELVRLHAGEIELDSQQGVGTTLLIRIPQAGLGANDDEDLSPQF
ncbi:MAG: hybrid sensor histidine kinase/response regulator [Chloroflexi bacterium]|nr:hybrid sensor histidine kinase/response regulator [Chloroflexota bacterium]